METIWQSVGLQSDLLLIYVALHCIVSPLTDYLYCAGRFTGNIMHSYSFTHVCRCGSETTNVSQSSGYVIDVPNILCE